MMNAVQANRVLFLVALVTVLGLGTAQKWNRQVCPQVTTYQSFAECPLGTGNACSSDAECSQPGNPARCCPTECGVKCQSPSIAKGCPIPIDLGLVLDSSGSIGGKNWKKVIDFVKSIVDAYDVSEHGSHVGIVTYSDNATMNIPFNKYTGVELNTVNLKKQVDTIGLQGGKTFMDKALQMANDELFQVANGMRPDKKQVCLFMTDGQQTIDEGPFTPPTQVARKLKERNIEIYSLGVGADVDVGQIFDIATKDGNVFSASNFGELQEQVSKLLEKQCKGCDLPLDIVFGVPNSQSLGGENANVKSSMAKLAGLFDVSNIKAHIGLVAYNEDAYLELPLDKAYSPEAVKHAINAMPQSPKHGFNTAAAMTVAADHAFSIYGGVRQTQPKVFILFAPRGSTSSAQDIRAAAEKLKKNGVRVMVVGMKNSADAATYSTAVTQPSQRFLKDTVSYPDLDVAFYEIADTVCKTNYGKCPVPDSAAGGGKCEVDKDCDGGELCCGDGFGGQTCTRGINNCFVPFEMVIAMDNSETVSSADFAQMKSFVRDLMWPYANSENTAHFGIMSFAGETQSITKGFRTFSNEQEIKQLVDSIDKTQDPQRRVDITFETAAKEFFSMEGGTRHGHDRYLLVLASDETSPGSRDLKESAKQLDFMGVQRMAVATNSDVPPTFLQDVASHNSLVFQAKEASELPQVAKSIQADICKPKPGSCPEVEPIDPSLCRGIDQNRIPCGSDANKPGQNEKENDWDCPGEQKCCLDPLGCHKYCTDPPLVCKKHKDLLVMMENTDAIGGKRGFGLMKDMVSRLVGAFQVSKDDTHIGIGTYSGSSRSIIRFNSAQASNKQAAQKRINKISFRGGSRGSTGAALEGAVNDFFDVRDGMRPLMNRSVVVVGAGYVEKQQQAIETAQALRSQFVDVFAVTIGEDASYGALRKIVSREVDSNVFSVSTADALEAQIRELVRTVCDGAKKELIIHLFVTDYNFEIIDKKREALFKYSAYLLVKFIYNISCYRLRCTTIKILKRTASCPL